MTEQHVRVELYHDFVESTLHKRAWVARAPYTRDDVQIIRDRGDEQSEPTTGTASMSFPGHDLNPNNAASPLYGKVQQNTPLRVLAGPAAPLTDAFSRSVTNGWGNLDTGQAWALAGGNVPNDYDVDGFNGTITFTDTNVLRSATVDTGSRDHLVRAIFDLSVSDVTGASVGITIRGRATDASNYYALNISYSTGEVITISIVKRVGGVATTLSTSEVVGFSGGGSADFDYLGELYVVGNRIYGKVWYRYVDEPLAYMVSAEDDDLPNGTRAGVGGIRATGNTNANVQVRVHDIVMVPGTIRFAGECASFKPRRSLGEVEYGPDGVPVKGDRWVSVTAAGVLRRMGQGEPPALSALWAAIQDSSPVVHWPVNEGSDATLIASALPAGSPMAVTMFDFATGDNQTVDWEPRSVVPWLEPMATPATGKVLRFLGPITMDAGTLEWVGDFTFVVDPDASATGQIGCVWKGTGEGTAASNRVEWIFGFFDAGSGPSWELTRRVRAASVTDTLVSSGLLGYAGGDPVHARLTTTRVGANVDWEIKINESVIDSGTLVASAWSPLAVADFQCVALAGQVSVSHVAAWADTPPAVNVAVAAVLGRAEEYAADRLARLCAQNGIAFELIGEVADTALMGPQPVAPFVAHVAEIEATDLGRIYESRHQVGLTMRTRPTLQSQTERLVLDVDDEGVAPDLDPDVDDLGVVNDVTVVRTDGSSARAVDEDGPAGVNAIGRYPKRFDVNTFVDESLPEHAAWRCHLRAQKATRYPQVTADLDAVPTLAEAASRADSGDVLGLDGAEPDRARVMAFGSTETIGSHRRRIAFNTGPAGGYDVLTLDDSGSLGRLETGGSELAAPFVAGTDTSMSVTVTGVALWSTAVGDVPFDIVAAGVRLTVTAVAGASSPQTFTITQTPVNGVTKTIEAGEEIRTYRVGALAL
jgi:hypothetical protein